MPKLAVFAARLIRHDLRRMLASAAEAVERGEPSALHHLRLRVKRLRYDLECVRTLAPEPARQALEQLAALQTQLGAIADAERFEALVGPLAERPPDGAWAAGFAAVLDAARTDRARECERLRRAWGGEGGAGYPKALEASISSLVASLSPKASA